MPATPEPHGLPQAVCSPGQREAGPSTALATGSLHPALLAVGSLLCPRPLAEYYCEQQGFALQSERADASQNHFFSPGVIQLTPPNVGSIRGEGCVGRACPWWQGKVVHVDPTQRRGNCAYASHSAKKAQEGSLVTLLPVSKDTETCKMGCKLGTTPLVGLLPHPRSPRALRPLEVDPEMTVYLNHQTRACGWIQRFREPRL